LNNPYQFPQSAAFGRMLAKSKIYEFANPNSKIKNLFVQQIDKITWSYKLSPKTINLPASHGVEEIQVFSISLKTKQLSEEVLSTIDKAIPSPILFELKYQNKIKYVICYKRPNKADKNKVVTSNYFESEWISQDIPPIKLPVVLNLAGLYQSFIIDLCPLELMQEESLESLITRFDLIQVKKREAKQLENQINKEKQFNRRVELNTRLNTIKLEVEKLNK
jgi:hypothetical protein